MSYTVTSLHTHIYTHVSIYTHTVEHPCIHTQGTHGVYRDDVYMCAQWLSPIHTCTWIMCVVWYTKLCVCERCGVSVCTFGVSCDHLHVYMHWCGCCYMHTLLGYSVFTWLQVTKNKEKIKECEVCTTNVTNIMNLVCLTMKEGTQDSFTNSAACS